GADPHKAPCNRLRRCPVGPFAAAKSQSIARFRPPSSPAQTSMTLLVHHQRPLPAAAPGSSPPSNTNPRRENYPSKDRPPRASSQPIGYGNPPTARPASAPAPYLRPP